MQKALSFGAIAALAAGGCGGTAHRSTLGAPPPKQTSGTLAGGLCTSEKCKCRADNAVGDGGAGVPDSPGRKRFEIHLGPSPHELWMTLPGTVLYKSAERPDECFYVDLATGDSAFEFRAKNEDGVSAAFTVKELGTKTKAWYDTFKFSCGVPGVCSFGEMDEMKAQQEAQHAKRLGDPCGSTKVKAVSWDHGKAADQEHPSDLVVRFTMDVYKFAPYRQPGDPACGKGGGRAPDDAGDAAPSP